MHAMEWSDRYSSPPGDTPPESLEWREKLNKQESLRQVWESQGFSQSELSRKTGLSTNTLRRLNKEHKSAYPATVHKLCKVLGMTFEYYQDHLADELPEKEEGEQNGE